ncbi:cardiolipin synthase [Tessaracoccus sp. G1721]
MTWDGSTITAILTVLLVAYWIVVAIVLITDDRDPTTTLAWLLVLLAFPLVGLVFYVMFGRNWKKRAARDPRVAARAAAAAPTLARIRDQYRDVHEGAVTAAEETGHDKLIRLIERTDGATVLPAHNVEILVNGQVKFDALKADLAAATDTINIQYFIWERDQLTAELTEILLDRLAAGVEVRMLNDWAGNIMYKKDEIKRLQQAGMRFHYDVTDPRQLNYRNHRKMVIIDATRGYTGGINVGQEYIDGGKRYPYWRDTHVRFDGPAVAELQKLFARRWMDVDGEDLHTERFFPSSYPGTGPGVLTQTVATGVDVAWDPASRAHVVAMANAHSRVWIQSPYLVPTPDIQSTMIDAALSGVDVRFMMTGMPDKKIAWWAAETFFEQLATAGVRVFRYTRGFFHAKTITIDGEVSAIGTLNFDVRSLVLHKELMTWFYDPAIAVQQEELFEADMADCEEITIDMIRGWTPARRLRNATMRLTSNLL